MKKRCLRIFLFDMNEYRSGADIRTVDHSSAAMPSAVYGLSVSDVNCDVGHAQTAVCVVDQIARLRIVGHGSQRQVTGRPSVIVNAVCRQCVGHQHRAVLRSSQLCKRRFRDALKEARDCGRTCIVDITVDPDEHVLPMIPADPKEDIVMGRCGFRI